MDVTLGSMNKVSRGVGGLGGLSETNVFPLYVAEKSEIPPRNRISFEGESSLSIVFLMLYKAPSNSFECLDRINAWSAQFEISDAIWIWEGKKRVGRC